MLIPGFFFRNTHVKILKFLCVNGVFWQMIGLSVLDWWIRRWTAVLIIRLMFICTDSLRGMSRWYRLFLTVLFFGGCLLGVFKSYFSSAARIIVTIDATNTTITTTAVQASVSTTQASLSLAMIVTVVRDPGFQYLALCQAFLPKFAIDSAGVMPEDMQPILEEREAAIAAWRGRPKTSAVVVLLSILIFMASLVVEVTLPLQDEHGRESITLISMRVASLCLMISGALAFFVLPGFFGTSNISWPRLKYVFSTPQGLLWIFYCGVFATAGLSSPDQAGPVSSVLGITYTLVHNSRTRCLVGS
jgi:hypothetical protein